MAELPLQFPVMMLTASFGCHDDDTILSVDCFADEDSFTIDDRNTLECRAHSGNRIVDASGMSWRIIGMTDLGVIATESLWKKALFIILGFNRRAQYYLRKEGPVPFEAIRDYVCAAIEDYSVSGIDEEAIPGKPESLFDHQELIDAKVEQCRMTTNMDELIDALKIEPLPRWR